MKKIIEIDAEVEKHLISLMHTALKTSGMEILASVDFIRKSIQTIEDEPRVD